MPVPRAVRRRREDEMTEADDGSHTDGLLVLRADQRGPTLLLRAIGEIDLATVATLRAALWPELHAPGVRTVMVDLRDVTFVAVAALRVLTQALHIAAHHRKLLRVIVDRSHPVVWRMAAAGQLRGLVMLDDPDKTLLSDPASAETVSTPGTDAGPM
jgi:anti-anti-sigma factor